MPDQFNPYAEWLGLPADLAEPNHYQLLGLPDFEENAARIANAGDRAMSRVRGFRPGANARAWSKLLDELLLAKGKLLDADRKREYDAELRETAGPAETEAGSTSSFSVPAAESAGWDPRFPPGMGPNAGKSGPSKEREAAKEPAAKEYAPPEPVRKPDPAPNIPAPSIPIPAAAPAPFVQPVYSPQPPIAPAATFTSVPPTAWPTSMMHPAAHAPAAAPSQPAPLTQPMYGAPQAAPVYPQALQPAQQYPAPAQYGMQQPGYGQQPYGQPAYAQPQYAPQPMAQPQYGAPAYPQMNPALPQPYAAPGYGQQYGVPTAPAPVPPVAEPPVGYYGGYTGYQPAAHSAYPAGDAVSGVPLDPMAPVAMPTALPGDSGGKQGRVVGFAAAQQTAIPKGKAVSTAATSAPGSSQTTVQDRPRSPIADPVNTSSAPAVPSPMVSASAPDSALAAAQSESSKSDKMLFYGAAAGILLLLSAIGFAIYNGNQVNREMAENPAPNIPAEPPPRVDPKPKPPVIAPKPHMPAVKLNPTPPVKEPDPPERIEPKPPKPMPQPQPMPMPKPPEAKPVETPVPMPVPKPPEPPPPPPEVKLTPAELMALSNHLKSAKEALRERNFPETDSHLAAAEKLAKSADQVAKTNRLKILTTYVKQFDRHLKSLMADENFDAGSELITGKSTRVVVVERNPNMIVIRVAGMNKSYALNALPDGLAMALIDKRLGGSDDAPSKLIKAAYLAAAKVSTEDNQAKAKALWEEARLQDPEAVADLPMVLTDSYDFTE
jgi:hypothetical protein